MVEKKNEMILFGVSDLQLNHFKANFIRYYLYYYFTCLFIVLTIKLLTCKFLDHNNLFYLRTFELVPQTRLASNVGLLVLVRLGFVKNVTIINLLPFMSPSYIWHLVDLDFGRIRFCKLAGCLALSLPVTD